MTKKLLLLVAGLLLVAPLIAQKDLNWRKHKKLADDYFEQGEYSAAAEHYESAWKQKKNKKELIYKAGESYYLIRDYRRAAEAYQNVWEESSLDPLVGLKYARSLKQDAQYDKAIQAFRSFNDRYTGQGKTVLDEIIRLEIEGCELGKKAPLEANQDIDLRYGGSKINSESTEFAPMPFSDDVLYFSSTRGGKARIYRSQKLGGQWGNPETPENFPVIQNEHYGHGSLSPDGSRFYFTICGTSQDWGNLTTRCEIFVIKRRGGTWSQPERLPDNINAPGVTSTQPYVVHKGAQEVLYFASNRSGGRGGMDLWYTTRNLSTDNMDFAQPVNLGSTVNTLGDEQSPFVDSEINMLYFSSNGHGSLGGFDIFSSTGQATSWSIPRNIGMPFNSSADDYFYVQTEDGASGFLVSNRVFGGEKITTRDDDIFEFRSREKKLTLRGDVYDINTNQPLTNITVNLFEIGTNNEERLVESQFFPTGRYTFDVASNKIYKVDVEGVGFLPASFQLVTTDLSKTIYDQPVFLERATDEPEPTFPGEEPTGVETGTPLPLMEGTVPGEEYTTRGTSPADQLEYIATSPRYRGTYYKIQLVALRRYREGSSEFDAVKNMAQRMETEYVLTRRLTRVLLGDFFSKDQAFGVMNQAQALGFPEAFVVQYTDGQRYGKIRE